MLVGPGTQNRGMHNEDSFLFLLCLLALNLTPTPQLSFRARPSLCFSLLTPAAPDLLCSHLLSSSADSFHALPPLPPLRLHSGFYHWRFLSLRCRGPIPAPFGFPCPFSWATLLLALARLRRSVPLCLPRLLRLFISSASLSTPSRRCLCCSRRVLAAIRP